MEVWSNIWTALSTPNEELTSILVMPMGVVELYISLLLFSSILNLTTTRKQRILYTFSVFTSSLLTLNFIPSPFNAFINYALFYIITYIILKTNILKTVLSIILPTIIYALIGTLLLNPLIKIINIDFSIAQYIPIYRISYLIICYLIALLIIIFLKHKKIYLKVLEDLNIKTRKILIINFLLALLVFSIEAIIIDYYSNNLPISISFLSFISLLAYFIISIYSLTRVVKLNLTEKQLENAEEYNKTLQILHDNIRGFKHDYDNTVAAIGGYIKTDDLEGLKQYYSQLEEDCVKVNRLYMLNPNIINNPGIYSLLTTKYNEAEELNIKMNITVLWDLSKINMKIYEFTKIFGILVDNAIDAAKETKEKIINITFKDDEKNNMQYLKIENSYLDKDVDIDAIFEKGKTSKENHTGLGLWEIRKILKSNNNLNLHTTKDNKYFTQQFEIYN